MEMRKKMKGLAKVWPRSKKGKIVSIAIGLGLAGAGAWLVWAGTVSDDFSTADKVSQTWNTTVDTSSGVVKLSTTDDCNDSVWFCAANDVCANDLGDGDYIVVARTDAGSPSTYQWKPTNTACDQPQCGTDGGQSGDNLVANNTVVFDGYPARDVCKDMGGRLPTINELSCIYSNRSVFGDNFVADWYWSSTEYDTGYAWKVNFSNGSIKGYYSDKYFSIYVRCVYGQ